MAPAQTPAGGSLKLTTNDAMTYLKDVKTMFEDNRGKYDEFLEVMRDFKSQRIDTDGVIMRVKQLFKGHTELILGFNAFLPTGYTIKLSEENIKPPEEKKPVDFDEAIQFVNKIKERFQNEDHVYKSFLDILNMYRRESKSIRDVYQEVAVLFHNHNDLMEEFTHFLPETAPIGPQHVSSVRAFSRRDERFSMAPTMKNEHGVKKDITGSSRADRDFSVDRPEIEHDRLKRWAEMERKDNGYSRDRELYEKHGQYDSKDIDSIQCKRKTSKRANDSGNEQLHQSVEGAERHGKSLYTREINFFDKVKEKLDVVSYQEFLKCLHIYSKEIIERIELMNLVSGIFEKHPDLVDGFNEFMVHCENIDGFLGVFNKRSTVRPMKLEDRDRLPDRIERDINSERGKDTEREIVDKASPFAPRDVISQKPPLSSSKEKFSLCKPVSDLDLSNCQRCTPSYRLLPDNYPIPRVSHRTKLGASVLNDVWVSVTSGSEDYSFKHMRKNQYEESLFKCEDDRFELDMLLESVKATARRVEELLEKMHDNTIIPEGSIRIEDHFTSLNLRCIEKLYGDHGLDAIDMLRKNYTLALPVMLTRLKQRQEEWSRCRSDFSKVWADVYAKNYQKSLDHRSFYFKQQDTKTLSTKGLLAEIKEINDKQRKEEHELLAIVAGYHRPIAPDMEFQYMDSSVHEDLYEVIKFSCGELCTSSDQLDKVMRIWTNFLEPVLGVPRSHSRNDAKNVTQTKAYAAKGNLSSVCEHSGGPSADGDVAAIVNGNVFLDADRTGQRSDSIFGTPLHGRVQNAHMADEVSGVAGQTALTDYRVKTNLETIPDSLPVVLATPIKSDVGMETVSISTRGAKVLPYLEAVERAIVSANGGCTTKTSRTDNYLEGSASHNKVTIEREEGEVSPTGNFEEDDFARFANASMDVAAKANAKSSGRLCQIRAGEVEASCGEAAGENDIEADEEGDESAQRSTDDSENASAAGEDVSGSESGNGQDCSRDDHEEDDDAGHDRDAKAESEGEADAHDAEGEITSLRSSERFLHTVKPIAKHVLPALCDKGDMGSQIFYGNDSFYVLFRLHQTLYDRVLLAKTNSSERKWRTSKDTSHSDQYAKFFSALYNLLDGSTDSAKYEDECRAIFGTQSYVLFTLDQLVHKVVKQLQLIAFDETDNKLLQLYFYEKSRRPEQFCDLIYNGNARILLHDENLYRFECESNPARLYIQLVELANEKHEIATFSIDPTFSSYLYNDFLSSVSDRRKIHGVFMTRNKRKHWSDDEYSSSKAMEGLCMLNGLECKISCSSSKVSYVLDTEDYLIRLKKRRRMAGGLASGCNQTYLVKFNEAKVQRFRCFVSKF